MSVSGSGKLVSVVMPSWRGRPSPPPAVVGTRINARGCHAEYVCMPLSSTFCARCSNVYVSLSASTACASAAISSTALDQCIVGIATCLYNQPAPVERLCEMWRTGAGVEQREVKGGLARHAEAIAGLVGLLGHLEHALVARHGKVEQAELVVCAPEIVLDLGAVRPQVGVLREDRKALYDRMVAVVHLAVRRAAEARDTAQEAQEGVVGLEC